MSTLSGSNISQTYQGLLKMTDSTSGVTGTLQTVQTGDGTNTPLQISQTQVNISGSLTINGNPVTNVNTGSFVTTSSFNAYTSSIDTRIDGIEAKTGSYATTGSNTFIGAQIIEGNVTFPSNSFVSTDNVSGSLYLSSLNQGTLYLNADGGEGDVIVGYSAWQNSLKVKGGSTEITGSLGVTNIKGTGSLYLQPNQSDARYLEVYNTSPTDTHITASGGQIFLGDDQTYVKVDNYGSVERIDIVAGNELVVSSSITNLTGSLHQSGTFYPDQVDWVNSSIVQSTGSYILTTNVSGVTEYDSYQNVASALQPFINTGSFNRDGLITTGSVGGTQSITGSLDISGTLTATSASITYLETVYETASIIYSSGSNQLGDASDDTQTLFGTVNLPSGSLNVTGATTSSLGFFGNLQGTASYATQALSASYAPDISNRDGLINTGSITTTQQITGSLILGDTVISGSLIGGTVNDGIIKIQSQLNKSSSAAIPFGYISSSNPDLSTNLIFGITTASSGSGLLTNNLTGSIVISGSNNILLGGGNRNNTLVTQGTYGYLGGSGNIVSTIPTLGTGSILRPGINNNQLNSAVSLQFTTSSISVPNIGNNLIYSQVTLNHQSGSVGFNLNGTIGGAVTSNQNITTANTQATISSNLFTGNLTTTLSHNSSSIIYQGNIGPVIVTNNYSSSVSTAVDNINVTSNLFNGNSNTLVVTGSNSATRRTFNSNLINGRSNLINSNYSGGTGGHLVSTTLLGDNLIVSASNTTTTQGGSTFVGRFNATGSLQESSQDAVFVVGTGTNAGSRRNALHIDNNNNIRMTGSVLISGSNHQTLGNVSITGSLDVTGSNPTIKLNGNTSINGVTNVLTVTGSATIKHSVAGQNALTIINSTGLSQPGLEVQGTTTLLGNTLISGSAVPLRIVGQSMTNVGLQVTGETTLIGNTLISGSNPLRVGINNNTSVIQTLGGSQFLYRDSDNNTVVGNAGGVGTGFFAGSEKNMIFNGFATPFATGSNNVLIQGGGDNFISGSNNIFIGNHNGQAGGSGNLLIGGMSYSSGSIFNSKFEINNNSTRIFHKLGSDPLQIGSNTQVTGSLIVTSNTVLSGLLDVSNNTVLSGSLNVSNNTVLSGSLRVSGDILFSSGSNKTMGTFVLDGGNPGVATVSNSLVTANSLIFLTKQTNVHSGNGTVSVTSKGTGTFSVTSNHNGDTDTVAYLIINPA